MSTLQLSDYRGGTYITTVRTDKSGNFEKVVSSYGNFTVIFDIDVWNEAQSSNPVVK